MYKLIVEWYYGIRDSLSLSRVIDFLLASRNIPILICKTFAVNGILFVGSMVIMNTISNSNFVVSSRNSELIQLLFTIIYYAFWLLPLYGISFILNTFWYADIANEAMAIEKKIYKNEGIKTVDIDIATRLYHELINVLVLIFFMIQSFLLSKILVSYIGLFSDIIHKSLMYSFLAFTYKWGTDKIDFMRIMAFFEKHFAYFCGFGFVFTMLTRIFPGMMSSGIYALSFPFLLLLATKASPPKDINIQSFDDFLKSIKGYDSFTVLKYPKNDDNIYTFDFNMYNQDKNSKIGVFSFSIYCIKAIQIYLEKKIKIN